MFRMNRAKRKPPFRPRTDVSLISRYICVMGDCFPHSGSWVLSGFLYLAPMEEEREQKKLEKLEKGGTRGKDKIFLRCSKIMLPLFLAAHNGLTKFERLSFLPFSFLIQKDF